MRLVGLACLVVTGCGFEHGSSGGDAAIDGIGDATDSGPCVTYSSLFDTCTTMMGTTGLTLTPGNWEYNTDTHQLSMGVTSVPVPSMVINLPAGAIDVIFVSSFTLQAGATLRGSGPIAHRPFGIASSGAVQIDGVIDMSSAGAGARIDTVCGLSVGTAGADNNAGAGGGGGGGFQGAGGGGSEGNANGTPSIPGGGGAAAATRPQSPIGGCDGGRGGGTTVTTGGEGGDGGGAIYIASGTSISVGAMGVIDASGHGGYEGGNLNDAGGGGGSGGMILLESKVVTISGVLAANGGGGGEGNANGVRGEDGQRSAQRAKGGKSGDGDGGDGGDGGAANNLAGDTTSDERDGGGGGGGGGAGFIAIGCPSPVVSGATISPVFAAWP